jgi:hypothetical protein
MESETYQSLIKELERKNFPEISNSILKYNNLNSQIFKSAIPYVINKLKKLYEKI